MSSEQKVKGAAKGPAKGAVTVAGRVVAQNRQAFIVKDPHGYEYNVSLGKAFFPVREDDCVSVEIEGRNSQYVITGNYVAVIPTDEESVGRYLFSVLKYKRVTAKACQALLKCLKLLSASQPLHSFIDSLSWFLYKEVNKLEPFMHEVKKVTSRENFESLLRRWIIDRVQRNLWLLGLSNGIIFSAGMPWHELYAMCLSNPYRVPEISIEKAKAINARIGRKEDERDLLCGAAVRLIYSRMKGRGWTYVPRSLLEKHFPDLKGIWSFFLKEYDVVEEDARVYLKRQWEVESFMYEYIKDIADDKTEIKEVKYSRKDLSQDQKLAILGALSHPFSFILGTAGTGKTTIIRELISFFKKNSYSYSLMAYTGKATMRISEVTGEKASTIHMYITKNEETNSDYIIIDEVSMVTTELIYRLVKTFSKARSTSIICLGDDNQLLPIEAGFFLGEIIRSKSLPIYYLSTNHRCQYENDGIYLNAANICSGSFKGISKAENFIHYGEEGEKDLSKLLKQFKGGEISPSRFTILCPYKDLDSINKIAQNIFTSKNQEVVDANGLTWRVGDPVVCTKNLYDVDLYNGEQGIISSVDSLKLQIEVKFDRHELAFELPKEKELKVDKREKDEKGLVVANLCVSYAMTVHRSQGSEWEYVVFYLPAKATANPEFINRNLVYTAITRARLGVFIIGSAKVFTEGAMMKPNERYDYFGTRVFKALHKGEKIAEPEFHDFDDFDCEPEDYM